MQVFRFVWHHLDHYRARFVALLIVGLLDGAAIFMIPVVLAEFTKSEVTIENFKTPLLIMTGLYLASLLLQWLLRSYGETIAHQFGYYIRTKYFKRLEALPMHWLADRHSGYVLSLTNKVSDGVPRIATALLWVISHSVSAFILFFVYLARESTLLAIVNAVLLIFFMGISVRLSRKIAEKSGELNTARADLLERYADFMANIISIKKLAVYSFAERALQRRRDATDERIVATQWTHAQRWLLLHGIFNMIIILTMGSFLWSIALGRMSIAVLILFMSAFTAIRRRMDRLSEIIKEYMEMQEYLIALDEAIPVRAADGADTSRLSNDWKHITFSGVAYQYNENETLIRIPELSIARGDKICITGESGQGKTTILNLIANFYEPQQGGRSVDGVLYSKLPSGFLQHNIVMISQEVELFHMSLRKNITLGQDIAMGTVLTLLQRLNLDTWVNSLEQGIDTLVGEKGVKLSSGQKQRINLMRGLLLNRDIYLLDEPTSHLDAATEARVVDFIQEHLQDKTVIIVSHRPALHAMCSKQYEVRENILEKV